MLPVAHQGAPGWCSTGCAHDRVRDRAKQSHTLPRAWCRDLGWVGCGDRGGVSRWVGWSVGWVVSSDSDTPVSGTSLLPSSPTVPLDRQTAIMHAGPSSCPTCCLVLDWVHEEGALHQLHSRHPAPQDEPLAVCCAQQQGQRANHLGVVRHLRASQGWVASRGAGQR